MATEIKLDERQLAEVKQALRRQPRVSAVLSEMLMKIVDEVLEYEENCWASLYELAGVTEETHLLTVNWVRGVLIVTPLDGLPAPESRSAEEILGG